MHAYHFYLNMEVLVYVWSFSIRGWSGLNIPETCQRGLHLRSHDNLFLLQKNWILDHFRFCKFSTLFTIQQLSMIKLDSNYPVNDNHVTVMGVSNHRRLDCLLNRLFRCRSKKTSKLPVTGLCEGNSPVTGDFPAQRTSNAKNVSIWWRHHAAICLPWII